ncbi:UDP-N-acetylmuramoyl-tripeptide--D-alanyl-D-alanine ligase, partial [Streptomyces yangpuensis]
MIALSLAEIADITGGRPHDIPDPSVQVTGPVVYDSREVRPGSLFAAFVGERVGGPDKPASAKTARAGGGPAAPPRGGAPPP